VGKPDDAWQHLETGSASVQRHATLSQTTDKATRHGGHGRRDRAPAARRILDESAIQHTEQVCLTGWRAACTGTAEK
jgi:hypothetical protein